MFNSLFNSLFGKTKENNNLNCSDDNKSSEESDQTYVVKEINSNVTAILLDEDKDWLFVEREADEEDSNSIAEKSPNNLQLVPFQSILSHLGSISENDENCFLSANLPSLYPSSMDDSWFLTPPECFSSLSSIQLESSPLENLLIEHPSMSVYYNFRRGLNAIGNDNVIDDMVVLQLSQHDIEEEQTGKVDINNFPILKKIPLTFLSLQKVPNKNRDKRNNKKSRSSNGPQKNITLVVVKKNNAQKSQDQRKTSLGKSAFERNNKLQLLRHAPKRTTVINQPSSRTMMVNNKKN